MRVPTYDNFQASPTSMPQPRFNPGAIVHGVDAVASTRSGFQPVQPGTFRGANHSDRAARETQALGNQLQGVGKQMLDMAIEAEQEVARVRVDEATTRAKEAILSLSHGDGGYTRIKGDAALNRPDQRALEDEYGEALTKQLQEIGDGLGTDLQKRAFFEQANGMALQFRAGVASHVDNEYKFYRSSVYQGAQATDVQDIAANFGDAEAVRTGIDNLKYHIHQQAKLEGKSAEWQEARSRELVSGALKTAMAAAIESGDVSLAAGYLEKYSKQMEAADVLSVRKVINTESNARLAMTAASEHVQRVSSAVAPTDFDRLVQITMQTESGGRRYGADGRLLESPKGAKGEMQVLDGTNKDPGYGVTPARDDSPEERARVGRDYLSAMLKEYGGDPSKAWAAYNAGPGRLDEALKREKKEGGPWLDYMPKETREYVAKNQQALASGGGKPRRPTFDEIDNALRADPRLANNPEAYKLARQDAKRQYDDMAAAVKLADEEATNTALQAVIDNGGNYAALPIAVRNAIPPDQVSKVMSLAEKVAGGEEVKTDDDVYYALTMAAANDPAGFQAQDLRTFFDKLSPSARKHFIDLQAKMGNDGEQKDIATATQQKSAMVQALGLKQEQAGIFHQQADAALMAAQRDKGKPLTQEERQKVLDRLVLEGTTPGAWFGSSKTRAFQAQAEGREFTPTFNEDQRRKATAALQRRGITKPTRAQIDAVLRARYGVQDPEPQAGATGSF